MSLQNDRFIGGIIICVFSDDSTLPNILDVTKSYIS